MTDVITAPPDLIKTAARLRASAEADRREQSERIARERERDRREEWRPSLLPLSDSDKPLETSRRAVLPPSGKESGRAEPMEVAPLRRR